MATAVKHIPSGSKLSMPGMSRHALLAHVVRRYVDGKSLPDHIDMGGLSVPLLTWLSGFRGDQTNFGSTDLTARLEVASSPAWVGEVALTLHARLASL